MPMEIGDEDSGGKTNISLVSSLLSGEDISHIVCNRKERNYLGFSDCSSVGSSVTPCFAGDSNANLNLKATELKLGLPGTQSPDRDSCPKMIDEKPLFSLLPSQKHIVSGNKRVFSDTMTGLSNASKYPEKNWMFKETESQPITDSSRTNLKNQPQPPVGPSSNSTTPASKAQVVGWPPIRSFRRNSLSNTSKLNNTDTKPSASALYVKVIMDGSPYLRKVDLNTYLSYQDLSSALENMFTCFTTAPGHKKLSEIKLGDHLLHGSDYVLTYQDKDGDWMLVGDVPWEMFINTCKKLKIMKNTDAIGFQSFSAPLTVEESKGTA